MPAMVGYLNHWATAAPDYSGPLTIEEFNNFVPFSLSGLTIFHFQIYPASVPKHWRGKFPAAFSNGGLRATGRPCRNSTNIAGSVQQWEEPFIEKTN
ncbi:hypothetical protein TNCV_766391 [Trichonephila clavipes]|nr:hypothetical protein TNCV_766391 [Trichonephila clavipes]